MKKWLTLMVLGVAVAATVGLSSRVAAQPESVPSDSEVNAHVDSRLAEVMHSLLKAQAADARTAALGR
ncbi:hypothetical protein [Hyalangium rubrum]|uniref:Secreted protein n=1 Tax=Hyalangium rubrum TaxID=3103134 RepID=A0ABU5H6D6_9BACT|nr:hypothetical protein [Hyalangium sp. s54d21]MDY7228654.1 hypothetical protein [Hyalangium sp. s54d21]